MNMYARFEQEDAADRVNKVPLFVVLSGRDRHTLARCPGDVIAQASGLGFVTLIAALAHFVGLAAALLVLNVTPIVAIIAAIGTATGLFFLDRIAVNAIDIAGAEAAVRRVGGTALPRLAGRLHGMAAPILRLLFSAVSAFVIGGALVLHFAAKDTNAELQRRQIGIDLPLMENAALQLAEQRNALVIARTQAVESLAAFNTVALAPVQARSARIADAEANADRRQREVDELRAKLAALRSEVARQREIMRCELSPPTESCLGASGIPKRGHRYGLALSRAEEAETQVEALVAQMSLAERAAFQAADALNRLRAEAFPETNTPTRAALAAEIIQAAEAVASFDANRTARERELVAANPMREVIDPESLAARLSALGTLAEDPVFFVAIIAVKSFAFAIELMALIAAGFMRRNEYHLYRGKMLADASRGVNNAYRSAYLDDAGLRAAVRKKAHEEKDWALASDILSRASSKARQNQDESLM